MSLLNLTVRPDAYNFSATEMAALKEAVTEADKNTVMLPVYAPEDILLDDSTGKTKSGYSYTDVSLTQVCAHLSPGLLQMIQDISGQWRKPGDDHGHFSGELAVEMFNKVARLRFDISLSGCQLVCDSKAKTIDGLVGSRYRYLSNIDLVNNLEQTYSGTGMKLLWALLYGRELAVRYVNRNESLEYTLAGEKHWPGVHCANSEIGGRSVRSALTIVNKDGFCALGSFTGDGGRVVHSGRSFDRRLYSLLASTVTKVTPVGLLQEGIQRLESYTLGLGGAKHEKATKALFSSLRRKRLGLNFAKRIVSSAAAIGRGNVDNLVDRMPDEVARILASRTGYDIYISLIREASKLPLAQRELAENVAYNLLTGKTSL